MRAGEGPPSVLSASMFAFLLLICPQALQLPVAVMIRHVGLSQSNAAAPAALRPPQLSDRNTADYLLFCTFRITMSFSGFVNFLGVQQSGIFTIQIRKHGTS